MRPFLFKSILNHCRGVVPIGRTAVSKTDGWEFESLHPCHKEPKKVLLNHMNVAILFQIRLIITE